VLDDQGAYKNIFFGSDDTEVLSEVKFWLLDTVIYGDVTPGTADVQDITAGEKEFPIGQKKWKVMVGDVS
jgi:hypothetical protein